MRIKDYSCKFYGGNNDVLSSFLKDARKYKPLSVEEEKALMKSYKENGDESAREKLILHNQLFVYSLAKLYSHNEDEVMDYVNEGNQGLIEAIDKFNPNSEGVNKLITYAVWYIRREMNQYLNGTSNIIVRTNNAKIGKKADKVRQKYFAENGYMPTDEEVMELLNKIYDLGILNKEDIAELNIDSVSENVSDDMEVENTTRFNEKTAARNDFDAESDEVYYQKLVHNIMEGNLSLPDKTIKLSDVQKDIIYRYYGIGYDRPYSLIEIGEMYNLDEKEVLKRKNNIIQALKEGRGQYKLVV